MVEPEIFDPAAGVPDSADVLDSTGVIHANQFPAKCEEYLSRSLKSPVRFVQAKQLAKSTRDAPWRLDVEVNGVMQSYVLRLDSRRGEHEYAVLRAMESVPIPTPRAYGWDPAGEALGVPCFLSDYIEGESLLGPMLATEPWAEELYIDTVCALQAVTREQLPAIEDRLEAETAEDVLETAYGYFQAHPHPLAEAAHARLRETMPDLPGTRFSNGDLWLDNLIVRDRQLAGVIDFENAGFSDPIFEFLLSFLVSPKVRGRGTEERYCRRMGFVPALLSWYRGMELFDLWRWVEATGRPFEHYNSENLQEALQNWLDGP